MKVGVVYMECKLAEYWISLYLDDMLEDETAEKLFEHIDICESCSSYISMASKSHSMTKAMFEEVDIESSISSSTIMSQIKEEEISFSGKRPRNKASIIAVILILAILFAPINSKPVFAYVNGWVKSLIIRQSDLYIKYDTEELESISKSTEEQIIYHNVEKEYYTSEQEFIKAASAITSRPCLPPYMLPDYRLEYAAYGKHDDSTYYDYYFESFYTKKDDDSLNKEGITVKLSYMKNNKAPQGIIRQIAEDEQVMEVTACGETGVIHEKYIRLFSNHPYYEATFILSKYSVELQITYGINNNSDAAVGDIIKIAEPLIQQIKEENL
jgi:hypothetical protein